MSFSLLSLHLALHNVASLDDRPPPFIFLGRWYIVIFSKEVYMVETSHKCLDLSIQEGDVLVCYFDLRVDVALHCFDK